MDPSQNGVTEPAENKASQNIDGGLMCLVTAAKILGIPADCQGVRIPSPPPLKSTYDENPRISRVFCYVLRELVEVGATLLSTISFLSAILSTTLF